MPLTGSLLLRLAMVCRPYANDLSKASYPFTHFPLSLWFCLGSNEAHGWQPVRVCLPLFYSFRMESWSPSLCYPMGQWPNDGTRTFSAESLMSLINKSMPCMELFFNYGTLLYNPWALFPRHPYHCVLKIFRPFAHLSFIDLWLFRFVFQLGAGNPQQR